MFYKFADVEIYPERFELHRAGELISVEPLVFDLLVKLIENPNVVFDRDSLIESVWASRIVSDSTVSSAIQSARKAIGDDGKKQAYIKTLHGRGFKFVGEVTELVAEAADSMLSQDEILIDPEGETQPEISPTKSDPASSEQASSTQTNRKLIWLTLAILFSVAMLYLVRGIDTNIIGAAQKSIAILPFSNTKPNPDTDFLGYAVADQIIGDLVYLKTITVRPSASVRQYSGQAYDPIDVADELGVDYVLLGNYLNENNLIRLNIELIRASSNTIVWRETVEVDDNSVFKIQDKVATLVAKKLNLQFSEQELSRIEKDTPDNPLAYEYYLRSLSYPLTDEGDLLAIAMLNKSQELDPTYAPTYAELGYRIHRNSVFGQGGAQGDVLAEQHLQKALALNSEQLTAMAALATLYTDTGRTIEALNLVQRMLAINPRNSLAIFSLGYIYRYAGLLDKAVQEMEKAVLLDPQNSRFRSLGITYFYLGEYQKCIDYLKVENGTSYALGWQALALHKLGKNAEALQHIEQIVAQTKDGFWPVFADIARAMVENNKPNGRLALQQLGQFDIQDAETISNFASYHAALGENDQALSMLEGVIARGYFNYPYLSSDSFMQGLHKEPKFQQLMVIAKQKHDAFKDAL